MKLIENGESYSAMLPFLDQSCFGSYLILPFQFQDGEFHSEWVDHTFSPRDVTTVDINEITRSMMSKNGQVSIGRCWTIPQDVLLREMADIQPSRSLSLHVETNNSSRCFSLTDSWLYVFHSHVAFFALGICFDEIETLADIVNLGGVSSRAAFHYEDASGRVDFSLSGWVNTLASKAGLRSFFSSGSNPFVDVFTYTLAVIPERFPDPDAMKQATFNLHLMIPFGTPVTDNSEEDVRFVYAKISEISHTFRWAACVTSQTISYITADPDMDLSSQMEIRGRAGLPVVMLALYEKYTCLRYTEALANTDIHHLRPIQKLKMEMLEFKAYGTIAPTNISRWSNIRQIYRALLETNEIPTAIADVDHKISILAEHQRDLESKRTDLLTNLITAFGIVSILASVLSIIEILLGANDVIWVSLILTAVVLCLSILLALFRRKDR